jgi:hypothetical protein
MTKGKDSSWLPQGFIIGGIKQGKLEEKTYKEQKSKAVTQNTLGHL